MKILHPSSFILHPSSLPLTSGGGFQAFSAVFLLLFALVPAGWPIFGALTDPNAWSSVARDAPRSIALLSVTVELALGVVLLGLPLGMVLAVTLFRVQVPLRSLWLLLLATAAFTPLALYVGGWKACIGPYGFFQPAGSSPWLVGMPSVLFIHSLAALPWFCGIVGIGLLLLGRDLQEQALLDAEPAAVLQKISIPLVRSAIVLSCLIAIVPALTDMTVTDLYGVRTFAEEVYTDFEEGSSGHATTLVTLPICALLCFALGRILSRWDDADHLARLPNPSLRPLAMKNRWLVRLGLAVLALHLFPVIGLIRQLGLESDHDAGGSLRWSPQVAWVYLTQALCEPILLPNLLRTMLAAGITTLVATVLAWRWRWSGKLVQSCGIFLVPWLFVLPGPVLGTALIEIFNRPGPLGWFYDGPGLMVYAQIIRSLPFSLVVLASAFGRLDHRTLEAAVLEGAGPWQLLSKIVLPLLWPILVLAFLISSALCLTELPITKLLMPPGYDPLSVRIFSLLHTGTGNAQSALCLVLLLFIGVLCTAGFLIARRANRSVG